MITNKNLIANFISGRESQNGSMRTDGRKLFSYFTCIAQRTPKGIIVNGSKYSPTTSRQQGLLRYALQGFSTIEVGVDTYISRGTSDLLSYVK
jgi:hypothetical protein